LERERWKFGRPRRDRKAPVCPNFGVGRGKILGQIKSIAPPQLEERGGAESKRIKDWGQTAHYTHSQRTFAHRTSSRRRVNESLEYGEGSGGGDNNHESARGPKGKRVEDESQE